MGCITQKWLAVFAWLNFLTGLSTKGHIRHKYEHLNGQRCALWYDHICTGHGSELYFHSVLFHDTYFQPLGKCCLHFALLRHVIPLSDDKHRVVRDSSLCTLEIRDNIWDKFFSDKKLFSQAEFCHGVDFVSDWISSRITYRSCISYAIIFRQVSLIRFLNVMM